MLRLFTLTLMLLLVTACSQPPQEFQVSGNTMGTTYTIKYHGDDVIAPAQLKALVDSRLVDINNLMSTYIPSSQLSQFNQAQANTPITLDSETVKVLNEALRLYQLSEGEFDVTIGPLINLWSFGPEAQPKAVPSESDIVQAMSSVGMDLLNIQGNVATRLADGVYVDLSAIGKGYGVDAVAELVEANGVDNYLVEIGGEMRVKGTKADASPWRLAIEKPVDNERAVQRIISIGDNAIATSGDYRNYFEVDDKRYSHLLSPLTGAPIEHNLVSVSVVHPSSMTADGWATAITIMGPEKGKALAESQSLAVLMVTKEDGEFVEYRSKAFDESVTIVK